MPLITTKKLIFTTNGVTEVVTQPTVIKTAVAPLTTSRSIGLSTILVQKSTSPGQPISTVTPPPITSVTAASKPESTNAVFSTTKIAPVETSIKSVVTNPPVSTTSIPPIVTNLPRETLAAQSSLRPTQSEVVTTVSSNIQSISYGQVTNALLTNGPYGVKPLTEAATIVTPGTTKPSQKESSVTNILASTTGAPIVRTTSAFVPSTISSVKETSPTIAANTITTGNVQTTLIHSNPAQSATVTPQVLTSITSATNPILSTLIVENTSLKELSSAQPHVTFITTPNLQPYPLPIPSVSQNENGFTSAPNQATSHAATTLIQTQQAISSQTILAQSSVAETGQPFSQTPLIKNVPPDVVTSAPPNYGQGQVPQVTTTKTQTEAKIENQVYSSAIPQTLTNLNAAQVQSNLLTTISGVSQEPQAAVSVNTGKQTTVELTPTFKQAYPLVPNEIRPQILQTNLYDLFAPVATKPVSVQPVTAPAFGFLPSALMTHDANLFPVTLPTLRPLIYPTFVSTEAPQVLSPTFVPPVYPNSGAIPLGNNGVSLPSWNTNDNLFSNKQVPSQNTPQIETLSNIINQYQPPPPPPSPPPQPSDNLQNFIQNSNQAQPFRPIALNQGIPNPYGR